MLNHPDRRRTLNFYHLEDRIIVVHIYNYISANDGKKQACRVRNLSNVLSHLLLLFSIMHIAADALFKN